MLLLLDEEGRRRSRCCALNVQSWILLLSPWIWTPFGLFCATTQLISVVLPAVWMPPPPVVEPEMELERNDAALA